MHVEYEQGEVFTKMGHYFV